MAFIYKPPPLPSSELVSLTSHLHYHPTPLITMVRNDLKLPPLPSSTYASFWHLLPLSLIHAFHQRLLLTSSTHTFCLPLLLTPTTYHYYLPLLLTPSTYPFYLPLLLTPFTYPYYLVRNDFKLPFLVLTLPHSPADLHVPPPSLLRPFSVPPPSLLRPSSTRHSAFHPPPSLPTNAPLHHLLAPVRNDYNLPSPENDYKTTSPK